MYPGIVVMGGDSVLNIVGWSPSTIYLMDIFNFVDVEGTKEV